MLRFLQPTGTRACWIRHVDGVLVDLGDRDRCRSDDPAPCSLKAHNSPAGRPLDIFIHLNSRLPVRTIVGLSSRPPATTIRHKVMWPPCEHERAHSTAVNIPPAPSSYRGIRVISGSANSGLYLPMSDLNRPKLHVQGRPRVASEYVFGSIPSGRYRL